MISRSALESVLGPRRRNSARARMGLAVSGRKANGPVIPGRPSGSVMWGIGFSLVVLNNCRSRTWRCFGLPDASMLRGVGALCLHRKMEGGSPRAIPMLS